MPSTLREADINFDLTRSTNNYSSNDSNTRFIDKKNNCITGCFQKIMKLLAYLNIEERGVERISPEDRTDTTIINTAIIWVTKLKSLFVSISTFSMIFIGSDNF